MEMVDLFIQVRAAAVFALGTFMDNSTERNDHINMIDQSIANTLLLVVSDGSPIVRKVGIHILCDSYSFHK